MLRLMYVVALVLFVPFFAAAQNGGNITFTPENADPIFFSHDFHIKSRGVKCSACHFRTFASSGNTYKMKKDKLTKRDFCEHCHNGLKGFDAKSEKNCVKCHKK